MSTKKHIILMILITIGIGGLILGVLITGSRIRKTQAPEEQAQAPSTPSPDSLPVVSDTHEEKITTAKRSAVSASTSISVPDQHNDDGQPEKDEKKVVFDENMYIDENGNVTDWEKWKLARMHKNGWYKPKDVPIIYGRAPIERPDSPPPDGVYIWRKYKPAGPLSSQEPPEHVKAKARELKEELDRAAERGDAKEMFRITKALDELHRPYKKYPSVGLKMYLGQIPDAWHPYFQAIWEAEKEAVTQEQLRLLGRAQ